MDRRYVLGALAAPALVACGIVPRRPAGDAYRTSALLRLHPPRRVVGGVSVPPVGAAATVSVGSPMAAVTSAYWESYVEVSGRAVAQWVDEDEVSYSVDLEVGKFLVAFEDSAHYYFGESRALMKSVYKGKPYDEYDVAVLYRADRSGRVVVAVRQLGGLEIEMHEVPGVTVVRTQEGPFEPVSKIRRELIYTGKSGRNLGLMYREYRDDMARPAFFQQLQYDTDADPVIGYQSARFKVLAATNTEVSYEVLAALTI